MSGTLTTNSNDERGDGDDSVKVTTWQVSSGYLVLFPTALAIMTYSNPRQ